MSKKIRRITLPPLSTLRRINDILLRVSVATTPLMAFIAIMPTNGRWR